MHIVTRKHLAQAERKYPEAAQEIRAWYKIVSAARWRSFLEVRSTFADADQVDGFVVFNIRRNRFRLIAIVHYSRERESRQTEGHVYIRSFLTHKDYDDRSKWNRGTR